MYAAVLAASGTPGTNDGTRMPARPSAMIATSRPPWSASTGRTALGRRSSGIAESASTAPPTGRVSAPEKATSPLSPTRKPGRREPVDRQQAAIDEKAVPISTARASPRRAPATVSARAAAAASPALMRDRQEVDGAGDLHLGLTEEMHDGGGQHGAAGEQAEERHRPLAEQMGHATGYRTQCVAP